MTLSTERQARVRGSIARRNYASGWARLAAQICQAPIGFLAIVIDQDWRADGVDRTSGAEAPLTLVQSAIGEAAALHVSLRGRSLLLTETRQLWAGAEDSPRWNAVRGVAAVPAHAADQLNAAAVIGVMDGNPRVWGDIHVQRLESLAAAITLPSARFGDYLAGSR